MPPFLTPRFLSRCVNCLWNSETGIFIMRTLVGNRPNVSNELRGVRSLEIERHVDVRGSSEVLLVFDYASLTECIQNDDLPFGRETILSVPLIQPMNVIF